MHTVALSSIEVSGSKVTFAIRELGDGDRLFRSPSFYFQYPDDVPIDQYDQHVWLNLFVGSISGPVRHFGQAVRIELPAPLPLELATMWRNHAWLGNTEIVPTHEVEQPHRQQLDRTDRVGVLFGGGKDSMFALGVTQEIFGQSNVVPLSFSYSELGPDRHRARRGRFGTDALRRVTGWETRHVHTTLRTALHHRHSLQTGNAVYLAAMPPIADAYGLDQVLHANEMNHFWADEADDGHVVFHTAMMRPEYDRYASRAMSSSLGVSFEVSNINFAVGKHGAFRILAERYPELLTPIFMCESTLEMKKWCGQCWKCFEYILLCLQFGVPCQIDVDEYVATSGYLERLVQATDELRRCRSVGYQGNLPWSPEIRGSDVNFPTFCHSLASIDLTLYSSGPWSSVKRRWLRRRRRRSGVGLPRTYRPETIEVLRWLKRWYGNHRFSVLDGYSPGHLAILGLDYESQYREILDAHLGPNDVGDYLSRDRVVRLRPDLRPRPAIRPADHDV